MVLGQKQEMHLQRAMKRLKSTTDRSRLTKLVNSTDANTSQGMKIDVVGSRQL